MSGDIMVKSNTLILAILLFMIVGNLNAEIIELGVIDTPGDANDVTVIGDLAYIADSQAGLRIIDVSNPEELSEIGFYDTPGTALASTISSDYAYIADGNGGLCIVDISDLENPQAIGAFQGQLIINDVVVNGDYVYLADLFGGLRVINVSDPENPEQVGICETPDLLQGLFLSGQHVYIADRRSGLQIVDVSNPEQPEIIGSIDTPGEANAVYVQDDYAYIADKVSGLRIIDISDPENPAESGSFETEGLAHDITVSTHYAYIADGANGFLALNISDPENPILVGGLDTPGTSYGIDFVDGYVFVADGGSGLRIVQLTPEIVLSDEELDFGHVDVGESAELTLTISNEGHDDLTLTDITIENRYFSNNFENEISIKSTESIEFTVTFAPEWHGMQIDALSIFSNDPNAGLISISVSGVGTGNIRRIGQIDTPGDAYDVAVIGDYAYVTNFQNGLRAIDISDPEHPDEVGFYDTGGFAFSVTACNNIAYVADYHGGVVLVDVSDPEHLNRVGYYSTHSAKDLAVSGDFAYVVCQGRGLRVIDVSDPEHPDEVGFYDTPGSAEGIAINGNIVYIADSGSGLRVIDVSDPEHPDEVGFYDTPNFALGVDFSGDFAYVADFESGIRVIDVSNPESPEEVGFMDTLGDAYNIAISGEMAYVADSFGLLVVNISDHENLIYVGLYSTRGSALGLEVIGDLAYIADCGEGLCVLDISEFASPVIEIVPDILDFGWVNVRTTGEGIINISSSVRSYLTISDISIDGNGFSCNFEGEFIIEPDENSEVTVLFEPEEAGQYNGTLTILSNDPLHGELNVELTGLGITAATVPLTLNWNLISINVSPPQEFYHEGEDRGADVIRMMEQLRINEENHHVLLMKNEDGRFYLPAFDFNNIPYWDLTEGYQVKVDEDVEAVWAGDRIPADADIPLERDWNMIAYFPTYELDASAPDFYALSPIIDNVEIAKDNDGNFMLPAFNFSNMPPWRETQGYQLKVEDEIVLNYPEMREEMQNSPIPELLNPHWSEPVNTGNNMSVLVTSIADVPVCPGSQIAAFSSEKQIVGSGLIDEDGRCGLAVWGDDSETPGKDGLNSGEAFELRVWTPDENVELDVEIVNFIEGEALVYTPDTFLALDLKVETDIPLNYELSEAFPNPFNAVTRISFSLPVTNRVSVQIFDLSGRLIETLVNDIQPAGQHSITWESRNASSGVYLVRVETSDFKDTRKVVLLR
jgi:hypothetical protein